MSEVFEKPELGLEEKLTLTLIFINRFSLLEGCEEPKHFYAMGDYEVLNSLERKGYILRPVGRNELELLPLGLGMGRELFNKIIKVI